MYNYHHLRTINNKRLKSSNKSCNTKNNTIKKYITSHDINITNYHSVLLCHHIIMSSQNSIEEILIHYLCRIITIIKLFILMITRHNKLENMCNNIFKKNKYLLIKSSSLLMMLIKRHCKISIKVFISIVKMVILLV